MLKESAAGLVVQAAAHRPSQAQVGFRIPVRHGSREAQALPDVLELAASVSKPRPSRVPTQPMADGRVAALRYRDWHVGTLAPKLAGGRPAYPGCPSAVSHWQGMLHIIVYLSLHAYYFITIHIWLPEELQFDQGRRSVSSPTCVAAVSAPAS
jgi:hypothetical protein